MLTYQILSPFMLLLIKLNIMVSNGNVGEDIILKVTSLETHLLL